MTAGTLLSEPSLDESLADLDELMVRPFAQTV
jgi:hypothetical protein